MKRLDKIVLFSVFTLLVAIIVLMVIMLVQKGRITFGRNIVYENVVEEKKLVSENILFLGDSITEMYDIDKYFPDYYHVQSGQGGNKTADILDHMDERVYRYNPSKVFLLLGINNFTWNNDSSDCVVSDIEEICDKIHDRNPYTEIYIESIYPYAAENYDEITEKVVAANKELKKYANDKGFTYIDMYSVLKDENGYFNWAYTDDGLHPNENGYKVITEKLIKYMK